jgi:PhzF family phenazine biosynthesis protein
VCPLQEWLPDETLQSIAAENNLSETAFFVPTEEGFLIRWFTPTREVDLCGHATLASAWVLFNHLDYAGVRISFQSWSGLLTVERRQDWLEMDFPSQPPRACDMPELIRTAFEVMPIACLENQDYILVFDDEADVIGAKPDMSALRDLDLRGVAITARSRAYDFVVRFFAPRYGIDEDPVTGSAFTQLIPYWSGVLGKSKLTAKQVSRRGGEVSGAMAADRVKILGRAASYLIGTIRL